MKNNSMKKITALGVVIFSFIGMLLCVVIIGVIDCLTALLVLKTSVPESFLKVGSVIGTGAGLVASAAFLTAKTKLKGIIASGIMTALLVLIKIIGNGAMGLGGYLSLNGLIGIFFIVLFALAGGVLGSIIKR